MPFPPTPSNTPSNTPTPSVTPSNTPTVTPSSSSCPNPTPSMTATVTPTVPPCPCVCGAQVTNLSSVNTINYSYLNCEDVSFSGTIAPSATLVLTCIEPEILVKWGSISTSGPATIVYGECLAPTPTITATATITPTITPSTTQPPTIYVHTCLPATIPADGRVYLCAFATSESGCTGSTTSVLDIIGFTDDVAVLVDGEYIPFVSMAGCVYLYPGQSCNCDCYYDFGPELSGYTLSAVTYPIFITGTTQANYVDDVDCYTPDCSQCIPTPTPTITPTQTPTPSITPTITPSGCIAENYGLLNETGGPLSWTALDCNGNGVGDTIPGGQRGNTGCVQVGTLNEGSLTIEFITGC